MNTLANLSEKTLQKLLPAWIYQRLIGDWNRDGFKKYLFNTGWIFIARIVTFVFSFFTITIVARYLGPENYGKLSYVQSFTAIFSAFASLGLDQILYRELIKHPEKENQLLGTALVTKLFLGIITLITAVAVSLITNDDPILTWMIFIITLSFIIQPLGVVSHLFNAQVKSKYVAYATIATALLLPILKLVIVYLDQGILYFSALFTLEALIYSLIYIFIYLKIFQGNLFKWTFSYLLLISLLKDSWPLLFASLSGYVYGRIDQIMIQFSLDSTNVGYYDVSVRLTEILAFLPGIILASLFPALINAKTKSHFEYRKRFFSLAAICLIISTSLTLVMFLTAPIIIAFLFGPEFEESINILRVYVWSTIGTVAYSLIQNYLIAENRTRFILSLSILGAVINITLNYLLIDTFGAIGAAFATLITITTIVIVAMVVIRLKNNTQLNLNK